jgi:6-phosphogluconolactonase
MSFKFEVIEPKFFAAVVAEEIVASIQDCLAEKDSCVIALAGGSTPVSIYRHLALPPYVDQIEWAKIDLVFGDERFVSHEDVLSNYRMVNENLLARLGEDKPRVHYVDTLETLPQAAADNYSKALTALSPLDSNNTPQIDLVLLGMGDDGHMASLFPGAKSLSQDYKTQDLVAVEDWPGKTGDFRITLTPRVLLAAKKTIFLVKGKNKAETLAAALNEEVEASLPVHIFRAVSNKVRWLVDSEAAIGLHELRED